MTESGRAAHPSGGLSARGMGLTGTHLRCEQGVCGVCTVLIDGQPARVASLTQFYAMAPKSLRSRVWRTIRLCIGWDMRSPPSMACNVDSALRRMLITATRHYHTVSGSRREDGFAPNLAATSAGAPVTSELCAPSVVPCRTPKNAVPLLLAEIASRSSWRTSSRRDGAECLAEPSRGLPRNRPGPPLRLASRDQWPFGVGRRQGSLAKYLRRIDS